jgi:hypothetical protein
MQYFTIEPVVNILPLEAQNCQVPCDAFVSYFIEHNHWKGDSRSTTLIIARLSSKPTVQHLHYIQTMDPILCRIQWSIPSVCPEIISARISRICHEWHIRKNSGPSCVHHSTDSRSILQLMILLIRSRKLRLITVGDPPRWPRDAPLSTKVGTKFRRQMAVAQSV